MINKKKNGSFYLKAQKKHLLKNNPERIKKMNRLSYPKTPKRHKIKNKSFLSHKSHKNLLNLNKNLQNSCKLRSNLLKIKKLK